MGRKSIYPDRRIVTPSQLGGERMAAIQDACDFDLDSASLDWAMWTVLKHDTHLRGWGLDGRQAALGLLYTLQESLSIGNQLMLVCRAHGHDANPMATHHIYRSSGRDVGDFGEGEREWLEGVANWHGQTQAVIDAGGDPRRPTGDHVLSDPCLGRLVAHDGIGVQDFLAALPRFGRFIVGRGWYRSNPMPRVVEIGSVQAHITRTASQLRVQRIGLGSGVSYSPPEPTRSRHVGIVHTPKMQLAEVMRSALIGGTLSRIIEHPALDRNLRIRAISKSGSGVAIRVDGCDPIGPLAQALTTEK